MLQEKKVMQSQNQILIQSFLITVKKNSILKD